MKKRLFIAIDISEDAREAAANHIRHLSEKFSHIPVKWISPDKFHITVKFLGMTDEQMLDSIIRLIDRNASATFPFDVELAEAGAFPNASRPRVLWIGINQPTGDMADLARRVDLHTAELGFEPENREFKPHLTLARIRDPRAAGDIGRAHVASGFGPISFACTKLVLFESHLGRDSRYEKLHTARFSA